MSERQEQGASASADRAFVNGAASVSAVPASVPSALLAELCSERVLIACAAAKAIPGDVWGAGADGHYAFLCGIAALMGNKSDELTDMIAHEISCMKGFRERHPASTITLRCPDRVLIDLGFAEAIEARSDETRSGSAEGESAVPPASAQTPPGGSND